MNKTKKLSSHELEFFNENGYLVIKDFIDLKKLKTISSKVKQHLNKRIKPYELEQEVNYPGSPKTQLEKGGDTIRRLLLAYTRDKVFKNWAKNPQVLNILSQLFGSDQLYLVQSHHNCIMTKQPKYSSETHWHKDIRYWNFKNNKLINTWLPLGNETLENGCLQVIPKTHRWNVSVNNLDEGLFLKKDLLENKDWLSNMKNVELEKGDLLFFSASLFHAAGKNKTKNLKNAIVFTYHNEKNKPLKETQSVKYEEIYLNENQ